ncbi:MAG: response regulator [Pseudomonadota bacterium]
MDILVVEHDVHTAESILECIKELGYNREFVFTGRAAEIKAAQKDFDILVLDILLPDRRAYETMARIKSILPEVEIITITEHNSRPMELEIRKMGIAYYMIKPIETQILKEVLEHIAAKRTQEKRII